MCAGTTKQHLHRTEDINRALLLIASLSPVPSLAHSLGTHGSASVSADTAQMHKLLSLCQPRVWPRELVGTKDELRGVARSSPLLVALLRWAAALHPNLLLPGAASCGTHGFYDSHYKVWRWSREILRLQSILPGLDHPGRNHLPLTLQCKCREKLFSSNYAKFTLSLLPTST